MKNPLLAFLLLSILLAACSPKPVTAEIDPVFRILWIGEETQQLNQVAMQTALMLSEGGQIDIPLSMRTTPAASQPIAAGPPSSQTKQSLAAQSIDAVVLQAFSPGQVIEADTFQQYAAAWIDFFNAQGMDVIVFYPGRGIDQEAASYQEMVNMVLELAWAKTLTLAPVGDVWQRLAEENSPIPLLSADYRHLSAAGVYLNGAVFYSLFAEKSPQYHPVNVAIGFDQPDTIIVLETSTLLSLQNTAWHIVETYQNQGEFSVFYPLPFGE